MLSKREQSVEQWINSGHCSGLPVTCSCVNAEHCLCHALDAWLLCQFWSMSRGWGASTCDRKLFSLSQPYHHCCLFLVRLMLEIHMQIRLFLCSLDSVIVLVCTSSVFSLAVCSWILVLYLPALCKPHPFTEVIQDNYTFKSTGLLPNHALTKGRCCEFSMELCSKSTMCRRGVRCIIKLPPCLL